MQIGLVDLQNAYESCVTMCHVPFHVVYSHTSGYTRQKMSPLVVSESRMYTIKAVF